MSESARLASAAMVPAPPPSAAPVLDAPPPKVRRWARAWPWAVLLAILAAQALYVARYYGPALATPDANGYWAQGSLLAEEGQTWFRPESDVQYIGMHWLATGDGRYASRYPPGLAVLVAAVCKLCGTGASVLINPVLATLCLLGLFLLARRCCGPVWALAAVAILAANPVFNQFALWCFAHMAVTFLLVWGVLLLAWWKDARRWWLAAGAGLLLGCIPTVRYPEAVFALGIAVYLLWDVRRERSTRRHVPLAVAAAMVPVVALMLRNRAVFGSVFSTGYELTGEQTGFGWSYFSEHFIPYLRSLNGEAMGPVFLIGVLGMLGMLADREARRLGALLLLLTVPLTLVYMAYYWGGPGGPGGRGGPGGGGGGGAGGGMRFLLPTFPCYALGAAWGLERALKGRAFALRAASLLAVAGLQFVWGGFSMSDEFARLGRTKESLARVTVALDEKVPRGSVIVAGRTYLEHLDFVRHWRLADEMILRGMLVSGRMPFNADDANAPSPMQRNKLEALQAKYGGLSVSERAFEMAKALDAWAGAGKACFVGSEDELKDLRGALRAEDFTIVGRVALPEEPEAAGATFGPPGANAPNAPDPATGPIGADGGDRSNGRGRWAGRGGRGARGFRGGQGAFGGGGGPMGRGLSGVKEVVIAEWTARPPKARAVEEGPPDFGTGDFPPPGMGFPGGPGGPGGPDGFGPPPRFGPRDPGGPRDPRDPRGQGDNPPPPPRR